MLRLSLLLVCLSAVFCKTTFEEENDVAILTKATFNTAIDEYPFVMVEFYAPWCGHCKALKPEYEKTAASIKKDMDNVLIAKVDATVESELATEFGVKGYPTIKFRKNGNWIDYQGERTADTLIKWIRRKLEAPLKAFESVSDVEAFIDANDFAVVAFMRSENAEYRSVLEEVADSMDSHSFAIVSSKDILDKYDVKDDFHISAFKKFDENRVPYSGEISTSAITNFVNQESIELIVEFSQESAAKVFGSPIRMHLVSFVPKSGAFDQLKTEMLPIAKAFKGKVHFLMIDTDYEDHLRILDFFGMSKDDVPAYRLINLTDDMTKYKPDASDFSEKFMTAFISDVLSGSRKPFLMSQEVPKESDEPVRVLVGTNYNEVTQDKTKAVFVELYAPWCGHCKQLAPIWEELGTVYKDQPHIIIAKMDATANEAEGLKVHGFPTLKYYAKGSSVAVEYSGDRTLEALQRYVDSEGKEDTTPKSDAGESRDEL